MSLLNRSLISSFHPDSSREEQTPYFETVPKPAISEASSSSSIQPIMSDWGISIIILFIVPLFILRLSQTLIPVVPISQINLSSKQQDEYVRDIERRKDQQYICILCFAALTLIISIVLSFTNLKGWTSNAAILGLRYGSLVAFLIAFYGNSGRLHPLISVSMLGILLISCMFLPRLGGK